MRSLSVWKNATLAVIKLRNSNCVCFWAIACVLVFIFADCISLSLGLLGNVFSHLNWVNVRLFIWFLV